MSLSFVKSAVISSTDGVSHNEETTIDNKETQSLRASGGGHKPLFEQLRANKDAQQEKDEEFQRSIRGMAALDEEDCAHLDSVERMKSEKEHAVKSGIEREVALFHAAREDRGLAQTVMDGDDNNNKAGEILSKVGEDGAGKVHSESITKKDTATKNIAPKFIIKKKRKRAPQETDPNKDADSQKKKTNSNTQTNDDKKKDKKEAIVDESKGASNASDSDNDGGGLLGLGCYDSDSD